MAPSGMRILLAMALFLQLGIMEVLDFSLRLEWLGSQLRDVFARVMESGL